MSLRLIRELRKMGATKITLEGFGTIEFGAQPTVIKSSHVVGVPTNPVFPTKTLTETEDKANWRTEVQRTLVDEQ